MTQEIIIPIVTFLLGTIVGWFAHKFITKNDLVNWERSFITVVVAISWLVSILLDIALNNYETPVAIHGVMGMVVGYFFEGMPFNKKK